MTDWTTIADATIDQDSPVTETLMAALRDNPIALAEGAADAPRVAFKNEFGSPYSVASLDITGLDDYGGCQLTIFHNFSSGAGTITIYISDDDLSSTLSSVAVVTSSTALGHIQGYLDFATGNYTFIAITSTAVGSVVTGTLSGASSAVDSIRVASTGASGNVRVYARFDGGEAAA